MPKKKGTGKLLLVEEMSYMHTKFGSFYKKEAIFDQGNALNYRGIPWVRRHHTPILSLHLGVMTDHM